MEIKDLTPNFRFYTVTRNDFTWYEYLCPFPVKNPKNEGTYHIIINKKMEQPERIYVKDLEKLLENGIFTLEDALDKQLELAEDWVKFLKEKREKNE